ncbi:oxidoreductase [Hyaloraphidium curvatum]|nr:oxidoreductase [Hyaloraphidium curvatum]
MAASVPAKTLQLQSLVKDGSVELSLVERDVPAPAADEVVVRIAAAPINPSDVYTIMSGADATKAAASGTPERPVVTAPIPAAAMGLSSVSGRVGQPVFPGNEAGGVVVAAGSSPEAQALLGKVVGLWGGAMYAQYRVIKVSAFPIPPAVPMREGITPEQAAACFVNPLTALAMVEAMKLEKHKALLHTAAASNLGQMLVKICKADGIPLVNVVRKPEQAELLKKIGAEYVCDSSQPTFEEDLIEALYKTGATLAFDAVSGGPLASTILSCMEKAAIKREAEAGGAYNRYGSNTFKQLYIYGRLDQGPTQIFPTFGFSWGMGGFLLIPFMVKAGPEISERMIRRVVDEIDTTFASGYTDEITLQQALSLDVLHKYVKTATGQKYLVRPDKN